MLRSVSCRETIPLLRRHYHRRPLVLVVFPPLLFSDPAERPKEVPPFFLLSNRIAFRTLSVSSVPLDFEDVRIFFPSLSILESSARDVLVSLATLVSAGSNFRIKAVQR